MHSVSRRSRWTPLHPACPGWSCCPVQHTTNDDTSQPSPDVALRLGIDYVPITPLLPTRRDWARKLGHIVAAQVFTQGAAVFKLPHPTTLKGDPDFRLAACLADT